MNKLLDALLARAGTVLEASRRALTTKQEGKTMAEEIPPGSWGGDMGADGLDRDYRAQQAWRMRQLHTQEETRRQAAQNAVDAESINQRAAELRVRAEGQAKVPPAAMAAQSTPLDQEARPMAPATVPPKQPPSIYDGIKDAEPGPGAGGDAWAPPPRSEADAFTAPRTAETMAVPAPKPPPEPARQPVELRRRSPEFMAGQAVLWLSTLRDLAETKQLPADVILETLRSAAELQYALADALVEALRR